MKRDSDLDCFIADTLAEHLVSLKTHLEAQVERLVAIKPLPPFVPPPVWTEGRHGAGAVVRAHGGIFCARRDTESEPGDDDGAWLPLVVGLAGFDMRWVDERKFVCTARLSDGRIVQAEHEIAVPIVRGYWLPEVTYMPGDRVFRHGEHHCVRTALGVDPVDAAAEGYWEKVGGKNARDTVWKLDEATGELTANGRKAGNLGQVVAVEFEKALAKALSKKAA